MNKNTDNQEYIIFFDGICILCNGLVDFLLKIDRQKKLKFASLQSDFAQNFLQQINNQYLDEDTIIFFDNDTCYTKSEAILRIASHLRMPYRVVTLFRFLPLKWRDRLYDLIARHRRKWFGFRSQCRIPDKKTAGRILG